MATEGKQFNTTIQALEALTAAQYHAIAFNDGKLANNGEEASGILQNKPASLEHATISYLGESRYAAGAAISAGAKLTVTTSGWFSTADSDDAIVGEAKEAVTSGSIGVGTFSFPTAQYQGDSCVIPVTVAAVVTAGCAFDFSDMKVADAAEGCDGIVISTAALSGTTNIKVNGVGLGIMGGGAATAGMTLAATTSGYFIEADSGDMCNAKALAAISSGSTGLMAFYGTGYINA